MADWNPGDLCQVRRGKRWVDAEIDSVEHYGRPGNVRVVMEDGHRVRADADNIRPRQGKRGKLPEPTTKLGASEVVADPRLKDDEVFVLSRPFPKPITARSLAYLAHVRTYPCCSCGTTEAIHAHHVASGGMGAKCSDYLTAPLCWRCHQHWHGRADLPSRDGGKWPESGAQSRAILWEAAARCLEAWVVREGER